MKLQKFVKDTKYLLTKFEEHYAHLNETNSSDYPIELNEEEWFLQLESYLPIIGKMN